ncbi:phage tail spike protein [Halobacillus ihumii]|uniref:phage tail spike protein n=1 Tax=Halobacillus ihumii TaxID=2686092 RepID=UPI0013D368BE|nr:phage tail spike protein [Halobacillus ihumii]
MATEKALFTDTKDFRSIDLPNFPINPYIYYNGNSDPDFGLETESTFEWLDASRPTIVSGARGQAAELNGSTANWKDVGIPASNKLMVSLWIKPTENDVSALFAIPATNRGDGYNNAGLHVALNYDSNYGFSMLNVRVYGATTSVNLYSNGSAYGRGKQAFEANKWYHICLVWDANASDWAVKAYVNGELILFTSGNPDASGGFPNSFSVGQMITAGYPFEGSIDDVIYCVGEDVWTETQIKNYYNNISNGRYLDYETEEGSLRLGTAINGDYTATPQTWLSPIVDLGEGGLTDYGKVQSNVALSNGTNVEIEYRMSNDGTTFDAWKATDGGGLVTETDKRYIQVRATLTSDFVANTPILDEIQILDFEEKKRISLVDKPLELFFDLEGGLVPMGDFQNAYDLIIEEKINAEDILTFKLPYNDPKRKQIGDDPVEMRVVIGNRHYIVKETKTIRGKQGAIHVEFICEALWTELREWNVADYEVVEVNAYTAVEQVFSNVFYEEGDPLIDWKIGRVQSDGRKRTLRKDWGNVLELLQEVRKIWGGELLFDTETKTVSLLNRIGEDNGVRFYYHKNLEEIERQVDTYDLVTRIYPIGKGELNITTVNNGVPYLENYEWVEKLNLRKKVRTYRWKDSRYTIPENLMSDGEKMLEEMSKPTMKYTTKVHDLSTLSGHEHEAYQLGDSVAVVDKDMIDEELPQRVVRRKWDVRKPENSDVELSEPQKTLADVQSRAIDDRLQELEANDPLSQTDAQQMTVFNQLLNSRADEGINSDWIEVGTKFAIANSGFSGDWSFVVTPNFDETASITQEVAGVAHRSTYTISAAVATEGDIVRGGSEDAFVGIKINVYYDDDPEVPETHYLGIPDVTDE